MLRNICQLTCNICRLFCDIGGACIAHYYRIEGLFSDALSGRHQADNFGASPFHFGAMSICHRGQIVMYRAVCWRESERNFRLARRPFLSA